MPEKTGPMQYKYRPMGTQANARGGALGGGEWSPLYPKRHLRGFAQG